MVNIVVYTLMLTIYYICAIVVIDAVINGDFKALTLEAEETPKSAISPPAIAFVIERFRFCIDSQFRCGNATRAKLSATIYKSDKKRKIG